MRIRQYSIEHEGDDLYSAQGYIGRRHLRCVARIEADVDEDDIRDLAATMREPGRAVLLTPEDEVFENQLPDSLAFALFAADHGGEDKRLVELQRAWHGLRELWLAADEGTRTAYTERAIRLRALSREPVPVTTVARGFAGFVD